MADNNLDEFSKMLFDFAYNEVPREFIRRQIEITIFLFKRLQKRTPKPPRGPDAPYVTGHLASNWRVTRNEPKTNVLGSRKAPVQMRTEWEIRSYLGKGTIRQGSRSPINVGEEVILIYNNVRYMKYVANGSSRRAPAGSIVELSLEETKDFITSKGWN
jgi:hypothetical protein